MLTPINQITENKNFTNFQHLKIAKEKTRKLKGGGIILEEIVLG